ncbi:MAG: IBR domain-containing protein [archaeon]|nr:IBR domain-containing protein [archaeon]
MDIDWDESMLYDDVNSAIAQSSRDPLNSSSLEPIPSPFSSKPLSAGSAVSLHLPSASSSHPLAPSGSPIASDLLKERHELIQSVASSCDLPSQLAQRILDYCGWNINTTVEHFFNDPSGLFRQVGLDALPLASTVKHSTSACPSEPASSQQNTRRRRAQKIDCAVCFDQTSQWSQPEGCAHAFCNRCWAHYFDIQVADREPSISCMGMNCKNPIPESFLSNVLPPDSFQRYLDLQQRNFVRRSADIRYCPIGDCNLIVRNPVLWKNCRTGTCANGHGFCFDCALPAHSPASCQMMKTWNLSEQWKSDQASTAWILHNTKDCPKCNVPIQKDRGCFLMVCRGLSCKHRFCWLCGGDWSTHPDHFQCATYNEVGMSDQPEWRDRTTLSESRLKRAVEARHYTMYQEHDRASRFEAAAQKRIEEHIASLQDTSSTFYLYNVDFVRAAYATMFAVRYFLKHTYIYSLYAPETPEAQIFQHQQSKLEMVAEKLSGLLEPDDQKQFDPEKVKSLTPVARSTLYKMAELK